MTECRWSSDEKPKPISETDPVLHLRNPSPVMDLDHPEHDEDGSGSDLRWRWIWIRPDVDLISLISSFLQSKSLFLLRHGSRRFQQRNCRLQETQIEEVGKTSLMNQYPSHLCPAVWSKHRRWLLMSMICLNPLVPSFVDLQFPNGQLTYVSGKGLTTSAFLPLCGGLLHAQGQYPGEMKFSYSCKTKWGTSITPMVQWPDKSFTLGVAQDLAWQRSGVMVRPTVQLSVSPTFGGSNPGWQAEVLHSIKEQLSLVYGCSFATHPSAFALVSVSDIYWFTRHSSSVIDGHDSTSRSLSYVCSMDNFEYGNSSKSL
ncbi:hypothetical protein QQ045_000560 [Rhodiola kirilowii]